MPATRPRAKAASSRASKRVASNASAAAMSASSSAAGLGGRHDVAGRLGDRERGGLRGRDAARHVRLHRADAALVGGRVEAVAARAALRLEQVVAALPCAQRLLLHADERGELLDPPAVSGLAHGRSIAGWTNL